MIDWLVSHIPPWFIIILVVHQLVLGTVAYLILLERKVASWAQDRIGPNRVGPKGLLQPIADGIKMFVKEDYQPAGVDKRLFTLAPIIMMAVIVASVAVLPIAGVFKMSYAFNITADAKLSEADTALATQKSPVVTPEYQKLAKKLRSIAEDKLPLNSTLLDEPTYSVSDGKLLANTTYSFNFQPAKLNIGVLFILALLSLAIYGVVLAGYASNNKYSFFGGMRAAAQMISYEIPLGLSVLCVALMFGTLELDEIVNKQAHYLFGVIPAWNIFSQPLAFVMFLICIHAEANRAPFDLAECEQELVGGYHTEYSSMRLGLLLLAEYAGMITTSAVCVAMFLGGWHFPGLNGSDATNPALTDSILIIAARCGVFFAKTIFIIFVFMWVRWSLPRFRYDQLMILAWRALIPISLGLLVATAVTMYFVGGQSAEFIKNRRLDGRMALEFLAMNIVFVIAVMVLSKFLPQPRPTNRRVTIVNSRYNAAPASPAAGEL